MLAVRLPEGHGLPEAAVLQLRDHFEVGAGQTEGGEEGLENLQKEKSFCPLIRGFSPTGSLGRKQNADITC